MIRTLQQLIFIIIGFTFPLIVLASPPSKTEEEILLFDSNIIINSNSLASITEIISVYANQKIITHGLQRQLPAEWVDSNGKHHALTYKVQQTLLNGEKIPYTKNQEGKLISIFVGDQNKMLAPGIYSFTIQYTVDNAVNNNQFTWDVTGKQWNLLIASAQATVQLPETATPLDPTSYMCNSPKNANSTTTRQLNANKISFATQHPLMPHECFTLSVNWKN